MTGDLATIANIGKNDKGEVTGDTLHLEAALVDPAGKTRCRHELEVQWDKDTVRNDVNGDKVERAHFVKMKCGKMEAGKWKFQVYRKDSDQPHIYEVKMAYPILFTI